MSAPSKDEVQSYIASARQRTFSHGGGSVTGGSSTRSLKVEDMSSPEHQSQPQPLSHLPPLSLLRKRSSSTGANNNTTTTNNAGSNRSLMTDDSGHGGGGGGGNLQGSASFVETVFEVDDEDEHVNIEEMAHTDDDNNNDENERAMSPTTAFLHQQFMSSTATQHEYEAKALLNQVMEQAKQAKEQGHHHRRTASKIPLSSYSIPHLVAVEQQQQQQGEEPLHGGGGGEGRGPSSASPQPTPSSAPSSSAPSPAPQDISTSYFESPPQSPTRGSGGGGRGEELSDEELSPPFLVNTHSLAETTQYVMALHQEDLSSSRHTDNNNKNNNNSSHHGGHHHRKTKSKIPPTLPDLSNEWNPNDDDEEPVPVERVHPADRIYAAATVLKAAARFQRMAQAAKTKPSTTTTSSDAAAVAAAVTSTSTSAFAAPTRTHSTKSGLLVSGGAGSSHAEENEPTMAIIEEEGDEEKNKSYTHDADDLENGMATSGSGSKHPQEELLEGEHLPQDEGQDGALRHDTATATTTELQQQEGGGPPPPRRYWFGFSRKQQQPPPPPKPPSKPTKHHHHHHHRKTSKRKARRAKFLQALTAVKQEWNSMNEFFQPNKQNTKEQLWLVLWALVLPSMAAAVILFYFVDNPPTGRCTNNTTCGLDSQGNPEASISWWFLFLGVRQVITWLLARASDVFFFDWLVLQHPRLIRLLGPKISLIIIQSKGWPSVIFWWALWDVMILQGKGEFNRHWLYWQNEIKVFTAENPSGDIPNSDTYRDVLITMFVVAVAVSIKRYFIGLHLGRRLYLRFNDRLIVLMEEIALISELALWARKKRDKRQLYSVWNKVYAPNEDRPPSKATKRSRRRSSLGGSSAFYSRPFNTQPTMESEELFDYSKGLEQWDEPKRGRGEDVHASKIVQFRQALAVTTKPFFFSSAFGPVESRDNCIKSADRLFRRLLKLFEEGDTVDVNKLVRWMYKGGHLPGQKEKAAHLMLLLNPDVENRLNIVDFVKGIDAIYQRVRLLENAVHNASHLDRSYEKILNYVFYFILGCVVLAILSLDPMTLLLTVSGLLVAFSFMIGPGSAAYFEGILMILGRHPYDVGDEIAIAEVNDGVDFDGAVHWVVEHIDLFTTTARLVYTNEVASFSNGSLARCRLVNMNRSADPIIFVYVKFKTNVPFATINIVKTALEHFVKDRPQEWTELLGFRTCRVEAQLNFVEYIAILQHRLSWQNLIPIRESKAAVSSFCVEVQRQLGCYYNAPPMPVEITMDQRLPQMVKVDSVESLMETAKQFEAKKND
ncbi:hypothetical protein ACA910_001280 [Epithemia clementina (nom. ined.)]